MPSSVLSATVRQVGDWLLEMNGRDKAKAAEQLKAITTFTARKGKNAGQVVEGVDSLVKLEGRSPIAKRITYQQVERLYQAWKGGIAPPEGGDEGTDVIEL
jgi:hypothetical protein